MFDRNTWWFIRTLLFAFILELLIFLVLVFLFKF